MLAGFAGRDAEKLRVKLIKAFDEPTVPGIHLPGCVQDEVEIAIAIEPLGRDGQRWCHALRGATPRRLPDWAGFRENDIPSPMMRQWNLVRPIFSLCSELLSESQCEQLQPLMGEAGDPLGKGIHKALTTNLGDGQSREKPGGTNYSQWDRHRPEGLEALDRAAFGMSLVIHDRIDQAGRIEPRAVRTPSVRPCFCCLGGLGYLSSPAFPSAMFFHPGVAFLFAARHAHVEPTRSVLSIRRPDRDHHLMVADDLDLLILAESGYSSDMTHQ